MIAVLVEVKKFRVPVPVLVILFPVIEPEFVKHPEEEREILPAYVESPLIFIKPEVIEIEPLIVEVLSI